MAWPTDPLDVRCVFAFGASLSAAPTTWTFKDCTSDLRVAEEANIKVGRSDRAKQPEPNQATFTLNNLQGQYTVDNPAGVNFPNVVENVPGIIAVRQNLNPTFEVDASDWAGINGTVARSTVRAFSGAASLLLTPTGGLSFASANVSALIPVRAGGAVYVDAWVYSPTGWANTAVAVDWSDGSSTYISTTTGPTVSVPAGVWTYLGAYLGPAPSNAAKANGRVMENGTPAAGNTLWIDEARTSIPRLCGYVDGWTPQFDSTGNLATCAVSMSGARRRLGRGNPALRSALTRSTLADGAVECWPLEDASGSTQGASAVGRLPLQVSNPPVKFAGETTVVPAGSAALPDFSSGGSLFCASLSPALSSTGHAISFLMRTGASNSTPIRWGIGSGSFNRARVDVIAGTGIQVNAFTSVGSSVGFVSSVNDYTDGKYHFVRIILTQSGGNIAAELWVDGVQIATNTSTTVTLGAPSWMEINPQGSAGAGGNINGAGGVAIFNGTGTNAPSSAVAGNVGETAAARITRLCGEEGVPLATILNPGKSMALGAQLVKTFLDHLLDCENADGGMMVEPFDGFGFGYVVRTDLYNLPVTLTIDNALGQLTPPFAPQHDDLQRQNDVTVTRQGGASARFIGDTSRGTYQDAPTLNVASDSRLMDLAAWRVHLGSPRGRLRHPSLTVNFTGSPTLAPAFFGSRGMGIRAQVINPPLQLPQGADLLVAGYTEKLGFKQWVISLLGSPYEVWKTFIVGDPVQGRLDTAGSQLTGGPYAQGAVSLSVQTNAGPLWITTANQPSKFPLNVDIAGQLVTVTGITGTSSPQTFTVNATPAVLANGAAVKLYRQAAVAL